MRNTFIVNSVVAAAFAAAAATTASAQSPAPAAVAVSGVVTPASHSTKEIRSARLSGVVSDDHSGGLPSVTVTAVHEYTGERTVLTTNDDGTFAFPGLEAGRYAVSAELPGFGTTSKSLHLDEGASQTLPLSLSLQPIVNSSFVVTKRR